MDIIPKNPVENINTHGLDKIEIDGITFRRDHDGYLCCHLKLHQYQVLKTLGYLIKGLVIHHKDFDKDNNFVDNFELLTNIEHREKHNKHDLKKVKCSVCEKEFYLIRNIASKRKANFCCSEECVRKNKTAEQIKRRKYWTQDDIIEYNRKERERTAKKRLLETEDQKNKRNKKALEYYHKNKKAILSKRKVEKQSAQKII